MCTSVCHVRASRACAAELASPEHPDGLRLLDIVAWFTSVLGLIAAAIVVFGVATVVSPDAGAGWWVLVVVGTLAAGVALNLYDCTHAHQLNRSNYLKAKPATAGSTIGEQLGSTRGSIGSRPDALASFSGGSPFSSGAGRSPAQSI